MDSQRKYLVNTVSLDTKLAPKALGCIRLGAVLGQFALVVVTHCGLTRGREKKHFFNMFC